MCADHMGAIDEALNRERRRLGTVNPQFSYYERLANLARTNREAFIQVYAHVVRTGGFTGL
jgi:hypothetical protein